MLWGWPWSKWKVDKEEERWLIHFLSCNVGLGFVKQGFCTCMRHSERDSDKPLVMGELSLQINGSRITDCQTPVLCLCLCMFVSNCVPFTVVSILVEPSCICAQDHILLCQTPLPSRQPFLLTFSLPAATHHAGLTHSRVLIIYWFTARVRTCVIKVRVHVWSSMSIHPRITLAIQNVVRGKINSVSIKEESWNSNLATRVTWGTKCIFSMLCIREGIFHIDILIPLINNLCIFFFEVCVCAHMHTRLCVLDRLSLVWE